jgi:hypothetical protein
VEVRMKKVLLAILLVFFCSLLAFGQGIKYKGNIKIEGVAGQTSKEDEEQMKKMDIGQMNYCEFEAMAQGGKYKMVYLTDFALFKKGSYMLGDANTKISYFVFPDTKTYWEFNIDDMSQLAQSMQKMVKMTYLNESVTVDLLAPKVINALSCTGKRVKITYDTQSSMMGMKTKSHTEQQTDYYTTAAYDVLALFGDHNWHNQGLGIGDPAFDKQIAAKAGFLGFPVQVITETWNDGKYSGKTTMTTKDIQFAAVAPANFVLPSGYEKTEPGAFSMMKNIINSQGADKGDKAEGKDDASKSDDKDSEKKSDGKDDKIDPAKLLKKGLKKLLH